MTITANRAEDLRHSDKRVAIRSVFSGSSVEIGNSRFALETKRGPRLGGVWKSGLGPAVYGSGSGELV